MLMETLYNPDKIPSAEPSLERNIVPDNKNTEKFTASPCKPQLNLLCGDIPPLLGLKEFWAISELAKSVFVNFEIRVSRLLLSCYHPAFRTVTLS